MILNKKDYLDYLREDKQSLGFCSKKKPKFMLDLIWKFERLLRKCEYYQNCKKGLFNNLYLKYLKYKFVRLSIKLGFSIPFNVFGKGLSIAHYGQIVVSNEARIGEYCRIHEGVTIGVTGDAYWGVQKGQAPILGNNVFLGSGCKIVGNIYIADDVSIGANSVVVKDINTPHTTWAGVPAKLISNNGSKQFINKKK